MHFRRNQLRFSSEADGPDFFISSEGDRDPKAEMIATIDGLCSGVKRKLQYQRHVKEQAVACQFPARTRWLKSKISNLNFTEPSCPELDDWRHRHKAEAVRLVFSSYYANNPSSVFGHTLLRLDPVPTKSEVPSSPLLSSGINFAAEVGPLNPVIYALYGLIGLFPGRFTAIPYYYKVREYSDFDSRDLWEYELKLTPEERRQFVDHIWELGFTHYNYYYFTENCSYHLLTALEGAVPRLEASQNVPWWVIPADSVKAIVRSPGILGEVTFRPSLHRQYELRKERLNGTEFEVFQIIVRQRDLSRLDQIDESRRAIVLDAALDYWDFKYAKNLLEKDEDKAGFKQQLLKLRSQLPRTEPLVIVPPVRPDLSHNSARYGLYSESQSLENTTLGLELRFALHDWLDPQEGYPETAKIEFFRFKIDGLQAKEGRWGSTPQLADFSFFEVFLLSPLKADNRQFSWRAKLGADRRWGLGCEECLAFQLDLKGGGTLGFMNDRALLFALAGAQVRGSQEIDPSGFALVPTWTLGARFMMSTRWLAWTEYNREYLFGYSADDNWTAKAEMRYSPTLDYGFGVGWSGDGWKDENKALLQFYLYR